jgi:hypothetical protein
MGSGLAPEKRVSKIRLVAWRATGVGFVVEVVFIVDVVQRIRQVVLQFIAFNLIGEIQGLPCSRTGRAIGSRHGVLLEQISKPRQGGAN